MATKAKEDQKLVAFYIDQIKKTKEIVNRLSDMPEFSPTLLLNSLLSLVILPCEDAKKRDGKRIFPGTYKDLIKEVGVAPVTFQPIERYANGEIVWEKKSVYAFVRKLRNGIAHQNLSVYVDVDRVVYVCIVNKFTNKACIEEAKAQYQEKGLRATKSYIIDFEIRLTINQLKKVALYIADSYLKAIEGE